MDPTSLLLDNKVENNEFCTFPENYLTEYFETARKLTMFSYRHISLCKEFIFHVELGEVNFLSI